MPQLKVHNVRFYNPEPTAIYCMALHRKDKKLAVSRLKSIILYFLSESNKNFLFQI